MPDSSVVKAPSWRIEVGSVALTLLVLFVIAWQLSTLHEDNTNFSIQASTQTMQLDIPCEQRVSWDLPPGKIGAPEDADTLPDSQQISIAMQGGLSVLASISADQHLEIQWQESSAYQCAPAPFHTRLALETDGSPVALSANYLAYRSEAPLTGGPYPILTLKGRILLGAEIPEGAGYAKAVQLPILLAANIEARTPDPSGQRRRIHAEEIETGSLIDTHACLDKTTDALPACVAQTQAAIGFMRVLPSDGTAILAPQISLVGQAVGIRPYGGNERRMMVTWWSRNLTSPWMQIIVALFLTAGTLVALFEKMPLFGRWLIQWASWPFRRKRAAEQTCTSTPTGQQNDPQRREPPP